VEHGLQGQGSEEEVPTQADLLGVLFQELMKEGLDLVSGPEDMGMSEAAKGSKEDPSEHGGGAHEDLWSGGDSELEFAGEVQKY
jgi:hypothetical protein